tara:strand:+ start:3509 stop:3748 length:240 start_codon:yes stop_codon:yes gene_type:complete
VIHEPDYRHPNLLLLRRSQVLAYGVALEFECRGINLGWASIHRLLNRTTRRSWSADAWLALLKKPYEAITGPRSSLLRQ